MMITKKIKNIILCAGLIFAAAEASAQLQDMKLLNVPIDISTDFKDFSNTYYLADSLAAFDPATGTGKITYKRYQYDTRLAFNNIMGVLHPVTANECVCAPLPAFRLNPIRSR